MRANLTEVQRKIYGFVREFVQSHGYPPTIREIQDNFGYRSPNSVVTQIKKLKEKGYVTNKSTKGSMTARTLQLVDKVIHIHTIETRELSQAIAKMKERKRPIFYKNDR